MDLLSSLRKASRAKKIHFYKEFTLKFKIWSLNIWFLQQCLRLELVPHFIYFKFDNSSRAASLARHHAIRTWLRNEIKSWYNKQYHLRIKIWFLHGELTSFLHPAIWDCLDCNNRDKIESISSVKIQKLRSKLSRLNSFSFNRFQNKPYPDLPHNFTFHQRTLNLSSTRFTPSEYDTFNLGLKFSPKPVSFNKKEHISLLASSERILRLGQFDNPTTLATEISSEFNSKLTHCQFSSFNNLHKNIKSINSKIKEDDLIVTKADKGNCVVILDKPAYITKTITFLSSPDFLPLNKNPLTSYNTKIRKKINDSNDTLIALGTSSSKLLISNPHPPVLYSLPKIHKENIPIRPIVSFINSPAYKLANFLNKIFNSYLQVSSPFSIKNTSQLINSLSDFPIPPNSFLVSFDIKNLFPSVPSGECVDIVSNLFSSSTLNPTHIPVLLSLLKITLDQNFFVFNNKFYQQLTGLAMGSPLSPLLSEVFLKNLEINIITSNQLFKNHVVFWRRYVDDIFCIFNGDHTDLSNFILFLNSIHPNIEFTHELHNNNTLPFLDLSITLNNHNNLQFSIYRKPTTTDHVIPFTSNHPIRYKLAAFNSLFHRLLHTPLSQEDFQSELNIIYTIAKNNFFPFDLIHKLYLKKFHSFNILKNTALLPIPKTPQFYFSLPFINPISEKIKNILNNDSNSISFKINSTLKSVFCKKLDSQDKLNKSGVYKLNCSCGKFYIGRTFRPFKTRIKEHFREISAPPASDFDIKSHFSRHVVSSLHDFSRTADILHISDHNPTIDTLEQIHINLFSNKFPSLTLNDNLAFCNLKITPLINDSIFFDSHSFDETT